jgi:hypothetical protein
MKRIIAAVTVFLLLGSSAAMAGGWHGHRGYHGYEHRGGVDAGPWVAAGLGVAILAIIASQNRDRDYYDRGGYYDNDRAYYQQSYPDVPAYYQDGYYGGYYGE